jgi:hypothetical protein
MSSKNWESRVCEKCNSSMYYAGCGVWQCERCEHNIEEELVCENCGKRKATQTWVGEGGTLAWVHGGGSDWCEYCCIEAQLKYAEEAAAKIPELKEKLRELRRQEIEASIKEAEDQGLYEISEHLTSNIDLNVEEDTEDQ